jgi:PTH2 family peptidyl-tRNA hydrolase
MDASKKAALHVGLGLLAGAALTASAVALLRLRDAKRPRPAENEHTDTAMKPTVRTGLTADDLGHDSDEVPEDTELKMVLCVRQDLNMSKGKTAAQVAHAALDAFLTATSGEKEEWLHWAQAWHFRAAAKITLKVQDEDELNAVAEAASAAGLPCTIIEDAGRTEIAAGSLTVVGIGPAPKPLIDAITGPKGSIPLRLLT